MTQPTVKNPFKIAPIISVALMLFFANGCFSSYKDRQKEMRHLPLLEAMMKDNTVAIATVNPGYKEVTMKIMGVPIKYYEVTYSYQLNGGGPYNGERILSSPPATTEMPLYYAKSEPSYSSFEPELDIKRIKEAAASTSKLYWSIGWVVLSLMVAIQFVAEIVTFFKERKAVIAAEEAYRQSTHY
ncbi:hypothetical protein [Chitinophaga rhizophila]|uniref:DUF3592 domain-containing protein n=1 Tax=Chitinophaga rhizophila TaxID=2866212 RepID=A0ABS7GBP6_9BACT|nr:hypothetical protein [Chitinophaga rhizophila]MBW8684751.1 hypothetical protein [Chitinophaga rhizophila]